MTVKGPIVAVCELMEGAGVPPGIVSLGKVSGRLPTLVCPGKPVRGARVLGGRANWLEDLSEWQPFDDPAVTHALFLTAVGFSGKGRVLESILKVSELADGKAIGTQPPFPELVGSVARLPRLLLIPRRGWSKARRLFSKHKSARAAALARQPFAVCQWDGLPFIPADLLGTAIPKGSLWRNLLGECRRIHAENEEKLIGWAKPVRIRKETDVVVLLTPELRSGFAAACRLWKFPNGTKIHAICVGSDPKQFKAADKQCPTPIRFRSAPAKALPYLSGSTADLAAFVLAAGNAVCRTSHWIWLDAEAFPVGLFRSAQLFASRVWESVDWGAPGRQLVNAAKSTDDDWPRLETRHWLGAPATLISRSFAQRALKAWGGEGNPGDFEGFCSRFAAADGFLTRCANLNEWGWAL